ncbi:hypothetical protein EDC04DRAFT_2090480 [Pisolithus marmoratus]|nr:hypothetical protein EDC04DRAFT_2090480 [Pisolithus marmoratus]
MLCMHLETPCETFAYLENRYGSIPRPDSWLPAEEAMQQGNSSSEQNAASETAQNTFDGHHEPEIPPREEDGSSDSPNDCTEIPPGYLEPKTDIADVQQMEGCSLVVETGISAEGQLDEHPNTLEAPDECSQHASDKIEESWDLPGLSSKALEPEGDLPFTTSEHAETQTGHTKPETEVVDMRQVVDVLPMFEGGTAGRTWHDKHVKEHEATDKKGQRVEDEVVENRDSRGWRSEASEPADNSTSQGCRHPTENGPQTFVEHNECIRTNSEMIAYVPDPPGIHAELPDPYVECSMLQDKLLTRMNSATSTELERHGTAQASSSTFLDSTRSPWAPVDMQESKRELKLSVMFIQGETPTVPMRPPCAHLGSS